MSKKAFPRSRGQRVAWLEKVYGASFIRGFAFKTDREVKRIFERMYTGRSDKAAGTGDPGDIADELML